MRDSRASATAHLALVVLVGLFVLVGAGPQIANAQTDSPIVGSRYDPRLQFRVLATARANIYFHQGEDAMARRLARLIDEIVPEVDRRLGGAPSGRLHVILVDQTDVSNGWATVVPYNLIEIAAVPPSGSSVIGNTDDWLRIVFAHEYTHVVHLEKSRGWIGGLRKVFGRLPILYPNLFVPTWQIEGLATFEESAITHQGRVPAGDFRMLLDEASAAGHFAPLDRASSAVIDWPGGASAYLYGAYFHQYLRSASAPRPWRSCRVRRPDGCPSWARAHSRTSTASRWATCGATSRARPRSVSTAVRRRTNGSGSPTTGSR